MVTYASAGHTNANNEHILVPRRSTSTISRAPLHLPGAALALSQALAHWSSFHALFCMPSGHRTRVCCATTSFLCGDAALGFQAPILFRILFHCEPTGNDVLSTGVRPIVSARGCFAPLVGSPPLSTASPLLPDRPMTTALWHLGPQPGAHKYGLTFCKRYGGDVLVTGAEPRGAECQGSEAPRGEAPRGRSSKGAKRHGTMESTRGHQASSSDDGDGLERSDEGWLDDGASAGTPC
ncbi:hypothetical protein GEV33_007054 [Tenebrio molitor]|uniref:Uncharacterized protein n=1 Tax=Tenebrio molitor TaxID=7067 RepID=A0A8J6LCQ5_TENMO|nr:hypothetical protein GEV33_007054 [Tenebrio molitor]